MRVPFIFSLVVTGFTLPACSKAVASELDPTNPLHCATQFQSYSILAGQQGDDQKRRGFSARSDWYVQHARSLPAEQLTPEAVEKLSEKIVAAPDGGLALAEECMKRQDADPDFQRLAQRAIGRSLATQAFPNGQDASRR